MVMPTTPTVQTNVCKETCQKTGYARADEIVETDEAARDRDALVALEREDHRLERGVAEDEQDQEPGRQQVEIRGLSKRKRRRRRSPWAVVAGAAAFRLPAVGGCRCHRLSLPVSWLRGLAIAGWLLRDSGQPVDHRLARLVRAATSRGDIAVTALVPILSNWIQFAFRGTNFAFGSASVKALVGPVWNSGRANCAV